MSNANQINPSSKMKKKRIELITLDDDRNLQYQGQCKITINLLSEVLLTEPENEEDFTKAKMITAMLKWDFVKSENVLFVLAENSLQDFALVFNDKRCTKVLDRIKCNKKCINIDSQLFIGRFIFPIFGSIAASDPSRIKDIMIKWIRSHKELYTVLIKANNVYDIIFPHRKRNRDNCDVQKVKSAKKQPKMTNIEPPKRITLNSATSATPLIQQQPFQPPTIQQPRFRPPPSTRTNPNQLYELFSNNIRNVHKQRQLTDEHCVTRSTEFENQQQRCRRNTLIQSNQAPEHEQPMNHGRHSGTLTSQEENDFNVSSTQGNQDENTEMEQQQQLQLQHNNNLQPPITQQQRVIAAADNSDKNEQNEMHNVFFNDRAEPRDKLDQILALMGLIFDAKAQSIDINLLVTSELCRTLDLEHAKTLKLALDSIHDGHFERILNRSLFVAYEKDDGNFGVVEGNIRLVAAQLYNSNTSGDKIHAIRVDYVIRTKPSRAQAIIISTLASEEAEKHRLQYAPNEILRNARCIMKYQPQILTISPMDEENLTAKQWEAKFQARVRNEIAKVLKVDTLKVVASVWRTVQISDEHFEEMLPCLVKHGKHIKQLAFICNTYHRRATETYQLCTDARVVDGDTEEFETAIRAIEGTDWDVSLRRKSAYDITKTKEENMKSIMGGHYDLVNVPTRKKYMEAFLTGRDIYITDVARVELYPTAADKQAYLRAKYATWLATGPDINAKIIDNRRKRKRPKEDSDEDDDKNDDLDICPPAGRGIRIPKVGETRTRSKGNPKKLKFKTVSIAQIQTDYFSHLNDYPHVTALVGHIFKNLSTNINSFPNNNAVSVAVAGYETEDGRGFDWNAFRNAMNQRRAFTGL